MRPEFGLRGTWLGAQLLHGQLRQKGFVVMMGIVRADAMDVVGMLPPLQPRPTRMQILMAMAAKGTCFLS